MQETTPLLRNPNTQKLIDLRAGRLTAAEQKRRGIVLQQLQDAVNARAGPNKSGTQLEWSLGDMFLVWSELGKQLRNGYIHVQTLRPLSPEEPQCNAVTKELILGAYDRVQWDPYACIYPRIFEEVFPASPDTKGSTVYEQMGQYFIITKGPFVDLLLRRRLVKRNRLPILSSGSSNYSVLLSADVSDHQARLDATLADALQSNCICIRLRTCVWLAPIDAAIKAE